MLKLAVMGDIHSNHVALEECIRHALHEGAQEFLFIGDYVSDCPYPQKVMEILYGMNEKYECRFIRGNREDYMLNHRKNPSERWIYSSASGNLLYTYENLTDRDLDFFESMDIYGIYEKEGYMPFYYCHGSMTASNELLIPQNENLQNIMSNLSADLLISGHTHIQETMTFGSKRLIHPGSVGVPWYYDGKAQYMMLYGTKSGWEERFFQLEYDLNRLKEEFRTSGIMEKTHYWAKLVLRCLCSGDDYTSPCLQLAMQMCMEAEGSVSWPYIPEKYWEKAFRYFISENNKP